MRAPTIQWPAEFEQSGPAEDPTIMLTGDARIDDIEFRVMALRMRDGLRSPDYRDDVPKKLYESTLYSMLDDVEDLADSRTPELITMNGVKYLLWMVPAAGD